MEDLTELQHHFAFGQNWASYAKTITEDKLREAITGLQRLLQNTDLTHKRFLDIGCGSGVHSLAALHLGAAHVVACDLDPNSVETTRYVLRRYAPIEAYDIEQASVFDLTPASYGLFDVVYSWGVLHHTGNLHRALRTAAALVRPGGLFIFALYRKTPLCGLWKIEKRWYSKASPRWQSVARTIYLVCYRIRAATKRPCISPSDEHDRGMDLRHNVHDWLGGYPYESISPTEVDALMHDLHFHHRAQFLKPRRLLGLLGSGCDEYSYSASKI